MSYLVILIVDNPDNCLAIMRAWEELGITGITVLESTGLGHLKNSGLWDDVPLMPSLQDFLKTEEAHHRTLLSVIHEHDIIEKMVNSVRDITGNLDEPHTGFLFVLPVLETYGIGKSIINSSSEKKKE